MVKLTGINTRTGARIIMLGITDENLNRLRLGQPIHVFGQEILEEVDVVVFWGETQDALMDQVKSLLADLPIPEVAWRKH